MLEMYNKDYYIDFKSQVQQPSQCFSNYNGTGTLTWEIQANFFFFKKWDRDIYNNINRLQFEAGSIEIEIMLKRNGW